jgi:hypothetical protein
MPQIRGDGAGNYSVAKRLELAGAIHPPGMRYLVDSTWVDGPPRERLRAVPGAGLRLRDTSPLGGGGGDLMSGGMEPVMP